MGFWLISKVEAVCDGCGDQFDSLADTTADAKFTLRANGWVVGTGRSDRAGGSRPKTKPAKCWCSKECWRAHRERDNR